MTAFSDKTKELFRTGKATIQKNTSTGTETVYIALDPTKYTHITLNKAGSTATLKVTGDYNSTSVDTAVFGGEKSSGTDDYQKGHTPGLTGLELDVTAYVGNVVLIVNQHEIGN